MIAILGAGSWGTAVAMHLACCGNQVMLWSHNSRHVAEMQEQGCNKRYLPDSIFPDSITLSDDLTDCLQQAKYVIIAVPSHAFADLLEKLVRPPARGLAWLTKGIDPQTHLLFSQLVAKKWGEAFPVAILSGPSFAGEVAQFLPTALTLATNDGIYRQELFKLLHQKNIRIYTSNDLIGVQLCGAVKNILAIACGISDGLGYGANAKAALITRGLAEMRRLGLCMGAQEETFFSLAGLGDLVLTCTDNQSRNRRYGLLLGKGVQMNDVKNQIDQVIEGISNAAQICHISEKFEIEMPICFQVNAILEGKINPRQAADNLMARTPENHRVIKN